ncbi:hypothetical protein [Vallitalea guaymasensis]|uniref:hypothetical protein n=1 Tax=Vallitalea guaymasensis TaxID=1185412 RepID=UPI002729CE18|nr:hypothetical protein [Vallitalea guaymasensis]
MKRRKFYITYFCVISIIIIFVSCTKNDDSFTYQDNSDSVRANSDDSFTEDLKIANETIVKLVVANLDEKINVINNIGLSMMANPELVKFVTKSNKEDNDKDREESIKEKIFMNIFSCKYITDIAFIKDQTYDVLGATKYKEAELDDFLKSELYNEVVQGKGLPVFTVGLFNDEQLYYLRLVSNFMESESNEFAVMIIEIDKDKLFEDIPFLDEQNSMKSALIDNNGQRLFDTGINYNVDDASIDIGTKIIDEEKRKIIIANAQCNNDWIYILEQEIKYTR